MLSQIFSKKAFTLSQFSIIHAAPTPRATTKAPMPVEMRARRIILAPLAAALKPVHKKASPLPSIKEAPAAIFVAPLQAAVSINADFSLAPTNSILNAWAFAASVAPAKLNA